MIWINEPSVVLFLVIRKKKKKTRHNNIQMVDLDEYKKGHADMAFISPCFLLKEKVSRHLVDVISTVIYIWS